MRQLFDGVGWREDRAAFAADLTLALLIIAVVLGSYSSFFAIRSLGSFVPGAMVVLLVARLWQDRSLPSVPLTPLVFSVPAALLIVWGASRSPETAYAFERVGKLAMYLIVSIVLWALLREKKGLSHLHRLLLIGFLIGILVCAVEGRWDSVLFRQIRSISMDDAVIAANRPAVILVAMMWPTLLVLGGQRFNAWDVPLIALTFAAVLQTESQSAQLALVLSWVLFIGVLLAKRVTIWGTGFVAAVFIVFMPFYLAANDLADLRAFLMEDARSAQARLELWHFVSMKIVEQPWLGYGLEASRFVSLDEMPQTYFQGETMHHPHNGVLQLWMEFGALGVVLALFGLAYVLSRISMLPDRLAAAAFACLVYCLLVSTISHGLWQSWWIGMLAWLPSLFVISAATSAEE